MTPARAASSLITVDVSASPRMLPSGQHGQRQIAKDRERAREDDQYVGAVDLVEEDVDHDHGHRRGEPHHRAPGRHEPEPHRGDEIDHREEHRGGLPRWDMGFEAAFLTDDAAYLGPMIKALEHRHAG